MSNYSEMNFNSKGFQCEAALFMPQGEPAATVICAPGFGALWQFGNSSAITAFQKAGYAVLAFNYRGFGDSEGLPRQFINPSEQLDDWLAAIDFATSLDSVSNTLVLWGSSLSGGHVLSAAAKVDNVNAVIAQVPHCSSRSAMQGANKMKLMATVMHALADKLVSIVGARHRIAIVGDEHDGACGLNYPGWKYAYLNIVDDTLNWQNAIPASSLLTSGNYNPIDTAEQINCPVFMAYGDQDKGILMADVEATAAKITRCELWKFNGDHFDCYDNGKVSQLCIDKQLAFLGDHLSA
jgi:hypothetical protein